jgi:transcriptional regulator with XRE-family HTH domain
MNIKEKDKKFLKSLGAKVRKARFENDFSQEELADRAGLDRTYITGIEKGDRNISVLTLRKIAEALKIDVTKFFNGQNNT